jgi:hypothetical protein
MATVRSLAYLLCAKCNDTTLHSSNVCQREGCGEVNRNSGNPPVPRPTAAHTIRAVNYDARAEQAAARRRARQARAKATSRIRA